MARKKIDGADSQTAGEEHIPSIEPTPEIFPESIIEEIVASAEPKSENVCDCGAGHDTTNDLRKYVFPNRVLRAKKSDQECVQKVAKSK